MQTEEKYINPFTDFGFKLLFNTESNKDILIDFLNAVIIGVKPIIVDISFMNNEQRKRNDLSRKAVFDIFCTDERGDNYIIEMQKERIKYFIDRAVFYTSFPITSNAAKGDWNFKLPNIFFIGLADFMLDKKTNSKFERICFLKDQDNEIVYDKLVFFFYQLPSFNKKEVDLSTRKDRWFYLLKNLSTFNSIPEMYQADPTFEKVFSQAEIACMTPEEAMQYQIDRETYIELRSVREAALEEAEELTQEILEREGRKMKALMNKKLRDSKKEIELIQGSIKEMEGSMKEMEGSMKEMEESRKQMEGSMKEMEGSMKEMEAKLLKERGIVQKSVSLV